ncbi:MAG: hypothetical protein K6U04_12055 [Armatimonadetes bacterium]|nr:hypothetical protein [Armatimonadota bacterium]
MNTKSSPMGFTFPGKHLPGVILALGSNIAGSRLAICLYYPIKIPEKKTLPVLSPPVLGGQMSLLNLKKSLPEGRRISPSKREISLKMRQRAGFIDYRRRLIWIRKKGLLFRVLVGLFKRVPASAS